MTSFSSYSISFFVAFFLLQSCHQSTSYTVAPNTDWSGYLGGNTTNQYSDLAQIDTSNVQHLQLAWTYKAGDADKNNLTQIQCNPIIIDGIVYGSTPKLSFFALDGKTGEEIWRFDPFGDEGYQQFGMGVNRGVAYWTDGKEKRILFTASSFLYAVDATTGQLIPSFGENGKVSLHDGFDKDVSNLFIVANTPGIVYKNLLILGSRVSESLGAIPGDVRAYNVKTGKIEWTFKTIPKPEQYGSETWPADAYNRVGGSNAWSGFSLDEEKGIVFVPTGSASFDFYGGDRYGDNLFSNCVIALNAATGERIWHFQTVHHDLWDRDLPAPPNLVTVTHNGKKIEAIAQITKSAHIFLLDRKTGKPLFPVEEVPVPPSKLIGEQASPTQPIPTKPLPFSRNRLTESDLTDLTPEQNAYAKSIFKNVVEGAPFVPPTEAGTIVFPGFDGGGEWGGAAVSPDGILYVNASEMAWILQMVKLEEEYDGKKATVGKTLYARHCMTCHGKDLKGASISTVPSLADASDRLNEAIIKLTIQKGRGFMPSFGNLSEDEVDAITAFLLQSEDRIPDDSSLKDGLGKDWPYPYVMAGYRRFVTPEGYPAIKPPWGTMNAIDLNSGELLWKRPLGELKELTAQGIAPTGTEMYGGPLVTAGDLIFIAATKDEKFRALDRKSGQTLWTYQLPAGGYATPSTYAIDGKQYVIIAAGGGKMGTKSGDAYLAFSLE